MLYVIIHYYTFFNLKYINFMDKNLLIILLITSFLIKKKVIYDKLVFYYLAGICSIIVDL